MKIGRLAPTFDLDATQFPCSEQLREARSRLGDRHAVVVGQVGRRTDAVRPGRQEEKLALSFLACHDVAVVLRR